MHGVLLIVRRKIYETSTGTWTISYNGANRPVLGKF